jgi:nucleoside-diphosphate kinase
MDKEKTLVLLKPDAIKRHLVGRILQRFEETGLKIVAMKMVWADKKLAEKHYPLDETWAQGVYDKTVAAYKKENKPVDFKDHIELGKRIQAYNMDFISEGPVIAIVLEGFHAVELVRKLVGSTEPRQSAPGTIRGDFTSISSYAVADSLKKAVRNLIHASDSVENAKREIAVWFSPKELHEHKTHADWI